MIFLRPGESLPIRENRFFPRNGSFFSRFLTECYLHFSENPV